MHWLNIELSPQRVYGLDILRALSILFVVYTHGSYMLASIAPLWVLNLPTLDGVTMFFVLSGFLIGGILVKTLETRPANRKTLLNFWVRRWFRTLPTYYLVLVFLVLYHTAFNELELADVGSYFLFVQNFAWSHPAFFPEAWTLAVEEWFYLLVPLVLFLAVACGAKPRTTMLGVIVFVILGSLTVRYGRYLGMESVNFFQWDLQFRKQVITRLDSLIFGVLGAWLAYYHGSLWVRYRKYAFALGLVLLLIYKATFVLMILNGWPMGLYYCVFSFTLVSCGIFLLLPLLSQLKDGSGHWYRVITMISLVSYSMYLIHFNVVQYIAVPHLLEILSPGIEGTALALLKFTLYWLLCVIGSILLYKYFEVPTTALRNHFSINRSPEQ